MEEYQIKQEQRLPSESIEEKKPGKKKKIIIALIVIVILLPLFLLAARVWDPVWNPFRPSPQKVIERMIRVNKKIKTAGFSAEVLYGFTDVNRQEEMELLLNIKGSVDVSEPNNEKMFAEVTGTTDFQGLTVSIDGEIISIGKKSYFRITGIPPLLLQFGLGVLKDQWIRIEDDYPAIISPEEEEEYRDKIIDAFKKTDIYRVEKVFPDKQIDGQKAYHYLISFDLAEIIMAVVEVLAEENEMFSALDMQEARESLEKIDNLKLKAEIWIGQKDYYLYGLKIEESFDMADFDRADEGFLNLKAEASFFDFNRPVSIEAPQESKSIEEILEDLFGQFVGSLFMGGSSAPLPDTFDESNDWFDDDWFMERQ